MSDSFKSRLIQEKEDIDLKISKLDAFISSDNFEQIDGEHAKLLSRQLTVMKEYREVLDLRISLLCAFK